MKLSSIFSKMLLLPMVTLMSVQAMAVDNVIQSINAYFDPAANVSLCSKAVLGTSPNRIVEFEKDGRVKVRLDITRTAEGRLYDLEMAINHKAFVPYFSFDKTPVPFEEGPTMVRNTTMESYLPSIKRLDGWFLVGYGIPYVRTENVIEDNSHGLYVQSTTEVTHKSKPTEDEIRLVRTAELEVNSQTIQLQITRGFRYGDPVVPVYYQTTAEWTKDLNCQFSR